MIKNLETHALVVQRSAICFFVICSIHFGWMARSVAWVNAFPQAPSDKPTFMCTQRGFMNKCGKDGCSKATQSLHGSKFAPRTWCLHPRKVLSKLGFQECPFDKCLFHCSGMLIILDVDNARMAAPNEESTLTNQSRNFGMKDSTSRWKVTSPNVSMSEWNTEMMEVCV